MADRQDVDIGLGADEVELKDLVRVFWSSRISLLICVLLFTSMSTIYAFITPIEYRATISLIPSEQDKQTASSSGLGAALSLVGISDTGTRDIPQAIVRIKSRYMLEGFIREAQLLNFIFYDKWDSVNRRWLLDEGETSPTTYDAYAVLNELLEVENDETTNVVKAEFLWHDRKQAAEWLNAYIAYFNEQLFKEEARRVALKEAYLTKKMRDANLQSSQQIISALFQRQIAEALRLQDPREYLFKVVDPAYTPEEDEVAWPKRKLIIAVGFVAGFFLWFLYVMTKLIMNPPLRPKSVQIAGRR